MAKEEDRHRSRKHLHGTPNLIIQAEERSILAAVDKALASSTNSQIVGSNGEVPLRSFFNRYLPYTPRVATGHFLTPSGKMSPQLDLMILDSRYPLLSENSDGSVLAMLHAVVGVVECKTRIKSADAKGQVLQVRPQFWDKGLRKWDGSIFFSLAVMNSQNFRIEIQASNAKLKTFKKS